MRAVCDLSLVLLSCYTPPEWVTVWTIISAWLHDAYDHKFDINGRCRRKTRQFLTDWMGAETADHLMLILESTSYTRENYHKRECYGELPIQELQTKQVNWRQILCNGKCASDVCWHEIIRNVVSDADKLEAIGKAGVYRCMRFGVESMEARGETVTPELAIEHLVQHYSEKLHQLCQNYIVSPMGVYIGMRRQSAMEREVKKCLGILISLKDGKLDRNRCMAKLRRLMNKYS
jgi:hypothetical protein